MSFIDKRWQYFAVAFLSLFMFFMPSYADEIELVVQEPFANVHTGPSSLHPIYHVVTKNEKIKIILQKTQWIKIKTIDKKIGWIKISDIKKTVYSNGESVVFDETDFEEYAKRRIEVGVQTGFIEDSPSFSITAGYLFNELIMAQMSFGQSIGKLSSLSILSVDAVMSPFHSLDYSPYFTLGVGRSSLEPHATLINPKTNNSSIAKIAIGVKKYLGERFVLRLELANYTLFSADIDADSNEEVTEWKIGFSTFF